MIKNKPDTALIKNNRMKYFRISLIALSAAFMLACGSTKPALTHKADTPPKREFRGVWIHTVGQNRYQKMNSAAMKYYLSEMVQKFDETGINALIFQVRPEADAFYQSNYEPWSRFLTGTQGQAPDDATFDPLAFLIEECHKRGMELHAWLNPYRVKSNISSQLAPEHIYWKHPERFVQYGNQLYFDPGQPENRGFICNVVHDIVSRYDVDAIHMDDYFYPYPIAGTPFPDNESFDTYAASQGFAQNRRDDWRRNNVNLLIQEIRHTISAAKPWVRFGISPFGIYRNKKNTPDGTGSDTNGLENYGDLYADIKLWVEKGWIDYNLPQLYWEIGHKAADYTTLLQWWNAHNFGQPLYIGQDLKRSIDKNEWDTKVRQMRQMAFVHGNCYWYGYLILDNYQDIAEVLKTQTHQAKALIPPYTNMHKGKPDRVKNLQDVYTQDMHFLTWQSDKQPGNPETAQRFVVYRFRRGEKVNVNNAENIVAITPDNFYVLPYQDGKTLYTYAVAPLDAFWNEGKARTIKVAE